MAIRTAVNRALTAITALPTAAALVNGNLTLLATATASSSATLDFTSGIDDTYDKYVFKFYNMHPATDFVNFQFNMSTDSGSNYNVTKTTTFFASYHNEADNSSGLSYQTSFDLAQSTAFQPLSLTIGNDNDQSFSGSLTIFNPASTTFVKHFISTGNEYNSNDFCQTSFSAGYGNTTSAVDAIRFQINSGNIDSGVIKLYGVGPKQ